MLALASPEFLELSYRTDMHLLIGRWRHTVTEDELRDGYRAMQTATLPAPCGRWLIDSRRRPTASRSPTIGSSASSCPPCSRPLVPRCGWPLWCCPTTTAKWCPEGHTGNFHFARFIEEGAVYAWLTEAM